MKGKYENVTYKVIDFSYLLIGEPITFSIRRISLPLLEDN